MDQWDAEEANIAQQADAEAERTGKLYPRRTCGHRIFVFINVIAGFIALAMAVGQLVGIVYYEVNPIHFVVRIYMVIFCILMFLNEIACTSFIRDSRVLNNWISRGLIYSFVGIMGVSQNEVHSASSSTKKGAVAAFTYVEVVAWAMVAIGVLYLLMGLLCCQRIANGMQEEYAERAENGKKLRKASKRTKVKRQQNVV
mmetsp:Transcript_10278/g.15025  ORF Transcript_10278/g.15025 Transcript_10278/m.15025 type:complete len:199 (-) Transcript_10278:83-679(-)